MLQVNHQLHCVDILRRSTWFNIDHYRQKGQFANMSDPDLVLHTSESHRMDQSNVVLDL